MARETEGDHFRVKQEKNMTLRQKKYFLTIFFCVFALFFFLTIFSNAALNAHCPKFNELIDKISSEYGVNPRLTEAIIRAESNCNPNARSSANCIGLMQVLPMKGDARRVGSMLYSPEYNIRSGVSIFRDFYDYIIANTGCGKNQRRTLELALACYNAGPQNVRKAGWNIPEFRETRNYVPKVIRYFGNGNVIIREGFSAGVGPIPRLGHIYIRTSNGLPSKGDALSLEIQARNLGDDTDLGELFISFNKDDFDFVRANKKFGQTCRVKKGIDEIFINYKQQGWPKVNGKNEKTIAFSFDLKPKRTGRLSYYLRLKYKGKNEGYISYPARGPHDTSDDPAPTQRSVIDVK